ncbi:MAG: DUF1579 family protein [Chthoniobacterales bacterium]
MFRLHVTRTIWFAALACGLAAMGEDTPVTSAQQPALEKLAGSVGVWESTTRYRFAPDMPVFESHSVETTQWSPNHKFLISDQRGTMPDGTINRVVVITWDPKEKLYKLVAIYAGGETEQLAMTVEGSVRTIVSYRHIGERMIRCENKMEDTSPTEFKARCECTDRETNWTFSEASSKKVQ